MVPAAIARRPIPAGAVLTGILCIGAAIIGYPMDLAVWPPVLSIALIVGVYIPLLEAGMQMTREGKTSQSAAIVVFGSALVNPVFGWSLTMLLDNMGIIGDKKRSQELSRTDRWGIPAITFGILVTVMALIGMLPGVPALLESFRVLH
jgi:flagellar biosynthesis protein FliQ